MKVLWILFVHAEQLSTWLQSLEAILYIEVSGDPSCGHFWHPKMFMNDRRNTSMWNFTFSSNVINLDSTIIHDEGLHRSHHILCDDICWPARPWVIIKRAAPTLKFTCPFRHCGIGRTAVAVHPSHSLVNFFGICTFFCKEFYDCPELNILIFHNC